MSDTAANLRKPPPVAVAKKEQRDGQARNGKRRKAPAHFASIDPGPAVLLPEEFVDIIGKLEAALDMPIWLLVQNHDGPYGHLDDPIPDAFIAASGQFEPGQRVGLVVHSHGGYARAAYRLARYLQRRCGSFTALVPRYAMSAATILVLGAESLILGPNAELGPLDAQRWDPDTERQQSVLNEVQALDRLRAYALDSIVEVLFYLNDATEKRLGSLLPDTLEFVAATMRPLLEKIDIVHYNENARILKVAEEYAVRLLRPKYPQLERGNDPARRIASRLVEKYFEHGFPIDMQEAESFGLKVGAPSPEVSKLLEALWPVVEGLAAIGRIEEASHAAN